MAREESLLKVTFLVEFAAGVMVGVMVRIEFRVFPSTTWKVLEGFQVNMKLKSGEKAMWVYVLSVTKVVIIPLFKNLVMKVLAGKKKPIFKA